jgi:hypothetical protein
MGIEHEYKLCKDVYQLYNLHVDDTYVCRRPTATLFLNQTSMALLAWSAFVEKVAK